MSNTIDIQRSSRALESPPAATLRRWARAAIEPGRNAVELCLRIVDRVEMRELNRRWRDRDYATNVLSFPAELPAGVELPLLGDVVISAPVVAEEAIAQGKPVEAHWAHLVVHGVLHLQGYDHETDADAARMESREIEILAGLGIADPYQPPLHAPDSGTMRP